MPQAGIYGQDGQDDNFESSGGRGNIQSEVPILNTGGELQEVNAGGADVLGSPDSRGSEEDFKDEIDPRTQLSEEAKVKIVDENVKICLESGLASFNGFSIKKDYPKAFKKCTLFAEKISQGSMIDEDAVIGMFLVAPRSILYPFFDEEKVYVNVTGEGYGWQYIIWGHNANELLSQKGFDSRVLAEKEAFLEAFNILEKRS